MKWTWKRGWLASQVLDGRSLARAVATANQVDIQGGRDVLADLLEGLLLLLLPAAAVQLDGFKLSTNPLSVDRRGLALVRLTGHQLSARAS